MRNIIAVCILAASALLVWMVFLQPDRAGPGPGENAAAAPLYAAAEWDALESTALNISVYIFRDSNRNGDYDVGDLPMAGVAVEMEPLDRPGSPIVRTTSNINGYANFKMARNDSSQPVPEPGAYRFTVKPPPGWRISSAEPVQEITFVERIGSVAGLVAEQAPHWVGLVPELRVEGQLVIPDGAPPAPRWQVYLGPAGGSPENVVLDEAGRFSHPVGPGRWVVTAQGQSGWGVRREFDVSVAPVQMRLAAVRTAPLPHMVVEDFDWLRRSVIEKIPNRHLGLNWDYLLAVDNQEYGGPGYVNGLVSGHAVAY
ncbi:MAG: hypothetical protein R3228_18500, partial [Halioglobus sp.]|nr:hypothetical protein [Halioglobus sp.]